MDKNKLLLILNTVALFSLAIQAADFSGSYLDKPSKAHRLSAACNFKTDKQFTLRPSAACDFKTDKPVTLILGTWRGSSSFNNLVADLNLSLDQVLTLGLDDADYYLGETASLTKPKSDVIGNIKELATWDILVQKLANRRLVRVIDFSGDFALLLDVLDNDDLLDRLVGLINWEKKDIIEIGVEDNSLYNYGDAEAGTFKSFIRKLSPVLLKRKLFINKDIRFTERNGHYKTHIIQFIER